MRPQLRQGYGRELFGPLLPLIPGREFAGTVVQAGAAVAHRKALAPGSRVFGVLAPAGSAGAYAEYVALRAADVAATPPSWSPQACSTGCLARPSLTPS